MKLCITEKIKLIKAVYNNTARLNGTGSLKLVCYWENICSYIFI